MGGLSLRPDAGRIKGMGDMRHFSFPSRWVELTLMHIDDHVDNAIVAGERVWVNLHHVHTMAPATGVLCAGTTVIGFGQRSFHVRESPEEICRLNPAEHGGPLHAETIG
jgi:hypothetical protein